MRGGVVAEAVGCALAAWLVMAGSAAAANTARADSTKIVTAQNQFALDLYRELVRSAPGSNVFFSPASVYTVLAMTAEGARARTAAEFGHVLRLQRSLATRDADRPWDLAPVHEALGTFARTRMRDEGALPPASRARLDSLAITIRVMDGLASRNPPTLHGEMLWEEWRYRGRNALAAEVDSLQPLAELHLCNAIWRDSTLPASAEFERTLSEHYGAGNSRPVDFSGNPDKVRSQINAWVGERTRDRIPELLPAGSVTPQARLILANAIFFRARWLAPFEIANTHPSWFRPPAGDSVQMPFMNRSAPFSYGAFRADGTLFRTPKEVEDARFPGEDDAEFYPAPNGFQLVGLHYRGVPFSMIVLLPLRRDGLAALESNLTPERLAKWIGALDPRATFVSMPRFSMNCSRRLREPLEAMGLTDAFRPSANLDGMHAPSAERVPYFVDEVVHQANLDVNERGTEAAAATALSVYASASHPRRMRPFVPNVVMNRPFFFIIRDDDTGAIVFLGRYEGP